ncbi:ATP-binding protein [Deferrisoma sp.]
MTEQPLVPRLVEPRVREALADTPVVLVHGPRQCGKTTLVRRVGRTLGYVYFNFDDDVVRGAAEADPAGFVLDLPERAVLDEVQRVPAVLTALKTAVDRDRRPGRFLLTGSANVLFLPRLSDSLAGRMEIVRLFPFSQCEIEGRNPTFLDALFGGELGTGRAERLGPRLAQRIAAGGYPAALARPTHRRRRAWYRDYAEALVQRDVRDLARIASLDVLPRLLGVAADQTAQLLNVSDLAGPFRLSRPTVRSYLTLLEQLFLVDELPAWHHSRLRRAVKTPKLHMADTGLACALLGVDAETLHADRKRLGRMLETFVCQELRRQASGADDDIRFHHFRDKDGYEVDLVLERGGREVAGVEVKAAATVTASDFAGLRKLQAVAGDSFACGVVLYDGETAARFGERLYALPVSALWQGNAGD